MIELTDKTVSEIVTHLHSSIRDGDTSVTFDKIKRASSILQEDDINLLNDRFDKALTLNRLARLYKKASVTLGLRINKLIDNLARLSSAGAIELYDLLKQIYTESHLTRIHNALVKCNICSLEELREAVRVVKHFDGLSDNTLAMIVKYANKEE